jgi:predicted GNAT family acetyltransferase
MNTPSPNSGEIFVRHNVAECRFETTVDGFISVAEYALEAEALVFTHTFVPSELRGRGIAEKLVRTALEWARHQQRRIVPACSYVAVFVQRNPEFQSLLRP